MDPESANPGTLMSKVVSVKFRVDLAGRLGLKIPPSFDQTATRDGLSPSSRALAISPSRTPRAH